MKSIELLPHNEIAYDKLEDNLKTHQMTSINHATGTGKSFILLKYLYEHKDKRILYVAPRYPIIDQLIEEHMRELSINKDEFNKLDTMIYTGLLGSDMKRLAANYDIVILDEYHRCGAKEWGKKVNSLLNEIRNKYPDTKVIGTTATEIRYLDKNRNMNTALFDDNACSTLTIGDAILQGILPAPKYYVFNYSLLDELNKLKKKIVRYYEDQDMMQSKINEILGLENELNAIVSADNMKEYIPDKGKYLAFSSTYDRIAADKIVVNHLLHDQADSEEVYYYNGRKKNKEIIDEFIHKNKYANSVLYSIDILNEGLHVKDVDGVFLLRKTTSPIIYFQQVGRLLSYSNRNGKSVVFDLVDNIKNHPAIYDMYNDVIERAKKLLIEDPENKERYERIIDNFKVVDKTIGFYPKIDELKEKLSFVNINIDNLNYYIDRLEKETPNTFNHELANAQLFRLSDYFTVDSFKKVKEMDNIQKPSIFSMTVDEYKDYLEEFSCIRDKFNRRYNVAYENLIEFYDKNNRLPSIYSMDEEELANKALYYYSYFSDKQKDKINSLDKNGLTLLEKIGYGEEIGKEELNNVLIDIKETVNNKYISNNVVQYLNKYLKSTNKDIAYNIYKSNKEVLKRNKIDNFIISSDYKDQNIDKLYFNRQLRQCVEKCSQELKTTDLDEYIHNIYNEITEYIKNNNRAPEYVSISYTDDAKTEARKKYNNELYFKKIAFTQQLKDAGLLDALDKLYVECNLKRRLNTNITKELIEFTKKNNGLLPSIDSKDKYEAYLARKYRIYRKDYDKSDIEELSNYANKNKDLISDIFTEYILFINNHDRRPVRFRIDDEGYELKLFEDFDRIKPFLNEKQQDILKETINDIDKMNEMKLIANLVKEKSESKERNNK